MEGTHDTFPPPLKGRVRAPLELAEGEGGRPPPQIAASLASAPWFPGAREAAAWAALVLVAALLRLLNLGARPLGPDEGAVALQAWAIWGHGSLWLESSSPVVPNSLSLLFGLLAPSDALARLPAALAGVALAASPLLLRSWLGRGPALGAAWLLALSPVLVLQARTVDGVTLALLALALVLAAAVRWLADGHPRWLAGLGAAVALGLGSSATFAPLLLVVAVAAWAAWGTTPLTRPSSPTLGARSSEPGSRNSEPGTRLQALRAGWPWLAAGFATVVVVLHTGLLTVPSGLQLGVVNPLWEWAPLLAQGGLDPRNLLLLLNLESLLLLSAAAALALGLALSPSRPLSLSPRPPVPPSPRRPIAPSPSRRPAFLALWALLSLPFALQAAVPATEALAYPLLPAALLGGRAVAAVWERLLGWWSWQAGALAVAAWVPLGYLVVNVNAAALNGQPFPTLELLIAAVGLVLLGALAAGSVDPTAYRWSALAVALSLPLLVTLAFNGRHVVSAQPPAVPGLWAAPETGQLVQDVHAWHRQHPDRPLAVDRDAARWLAWPLRNVPTVVVDPAQAELVALRAPDPRLAHGGPLRPLGARVRLADRADDPRAWWLWLAGREGWVVVEPRAIIFRPSPASNLLPPTGVVHGSG